MNALNLKEAPHCQLCGHEIAVAGEGSVTYVEFKNRLIAALYQYTKELIETDSKELDVIEQVRRNCETLMKWMFP